jgi:hypothetical protein
MYVTNPNSSRLPTELKPPHVVERPEGSGTFVRINDSYLSHIVYLGWPVAGDDDAIEPCGTGFLVFHDECTYIVTAAHVAMPFHRDKLPMAVRINKTADGLGKVERVEQATWHFHPDDKIDVAVMPFEAPPWARAKFFKTKNVATEFKLEAKNIGPGDLAYIVGMFKMLPGKARVNPVVHVGHIASMARGERITTQDWRTEKDPADRLDIEGYLVQVPTMGGASGSPVWVRRTLTPILRRGDENLVSAIAGSIWLLGLWHGAWEQDISKPLKQPQRTTVIERGIGITIPAPRIMETLDKPELIAMRAKIKENRHKDVPATPQTSMQISGEPTFTAVLQRMLATSPSPKKSPAKRTPAKKARKS